MKKKNLYVTLALLAFISTTVSAQNRTYEGPNKMNTWSITGYGGITRFFGDLNQYDFKRGEKVPVTGGFGLSLNKQLTPLFGVQLTAWNGNLAGSKMDVVSSITGRSQDVYFRSPSFC